MQSTQQPPIIPTLPKMTCLSSLQSSIDSLTLALILQVLIHSENTNQAPRHTGTANEHHGLDKKWRKMITHMKMKKSNQKCTVCLESFNEGQVIKQLPCKHILHRQCGKEWLKMNRRCPICRLDVEAHFRECESKMIEN